MLYDGMNRFTENPKEAHLEEESELVSLVRKHEGNAVAKIHALRATKDQLNATTRNLAIPGTSQGVKL
jgi:hypothetical protein